MVPSWRSLGFTFGLGIAVCAWSVAELNAIEIDSAMLVDPTLEPVEEVVVFSPKLMPLWLSALNRPEDDLKRQAAEAIAAASRLGMQGLDDLVEPLMRDLASDQTHPTARMAIARALIALDAPQAAALLAERAESDGLAVAQVVEPTLADWDYAPQRDAWLARLEDPRVSKQKLILAVQGLGSVREVRAAESLRRLALDPSRPANIRIVAARSLSRLDGQDLPNLAGALLASPHDQHLINRLVAAELLVNDPSSAAHALWMELAGDQEPAVVNMALKAILKSAPRLTAAYNQQFVDSPDANIRSSLIDLLLAQPSLEAVGLLGELLADPHPELRQKACDALVELAAVDEWDGPVRDVVMERLNSEQPEVIEQAALAAGALEHRPAGERLISLLDAPQNEVALAAAWGLRRIADPATGEAIRDKIARETQRRLELVQALAPIAAANPYVVPDYPPVDASNAQLEQLLEALALMQDEAAEPLFQTFLPKPPMPQIGEPPVLETEKQVVLRAAAVWGLGVFHGDAAPDELRQSLRDRFGDVDSKHPEHPLVRRMSAISLARMRDLPAVDLLMPHCEPPKAYTELGRGCRWAVQELTGEPLPDLPPIPRAMADWFLVPLEP